MVFTQMILVDKFLNDRDYQDFHLIDLTTNFQLKHHEFQQVPTIVQLGGNSLSEMLNVAKILQGYCDGIDINMGCPQSHALDKGYGASFLTRRRWTEAEQIVNGLSNGLNVPISAKLRLNDTGDTTKLGQLLENSGARLLTLHARHISSKRRRKGPPFLGEVTKLKQSVNIPVLSNGGVQSFTDLDRNRILTGADGLMVGEPLLTNPFLFENPSSFEPDDFGKEYLEICQRIPQTVKVSQIQKHFDWILDCPSRKSNPAYRKLHQKIRESNSTSQIYDLFWNINL